MANTLELNQPAHPDVQNAIHRALSQFRLDRYPSEPICIYLGHREYYALLSTPHIHRVFYTTPIKETYQGVEIIRVFKDEHLQVA